MVESSLKGNGFAWTQGDDRTIREFATIGFRLLSEKGGVKEKQDDCHCF